MRLVRDVAAANRNRLSERIGDHLGEHVIGEHMVIAAVERWLTGKYAHLRDWDTAPSVLVTNPDAERSGRDRWLA